MPLLEAFSDENQTMKYKVATLPRGTAVLPVLDLGFAAITLKQGASLAITPQTLNYLGNASAFETSGYSATIADVRTMSTFNGVGVQSSAAATAKCYFNNNIRYKCIIYSNRISN
jgi:Lhr-like helicase